jgi:hypothetical protein
MASIGGTDVGVYSLHLKSNLTMKGDKAVEAHKNIRKREVAIDQLLNHIRDVIASKLPMVKSFVVGGDFNTNVDQPDFAQERTLTKLTTAGFRNSMEGAAAAQRITHPGSGPYPDATFDYLFRANLIPAKPLISASKASDHYPVTCDFSLGGSYTQIAPVPPDRSQVQLGNEDGKAPAPSSVPQFVTLIQPVRIKIPYGETVLPRGLKLPVISRDAQTVTVRYLDGTQTIPIASTDLR